MKINREPINPNSQLDQNDDVFRGEHPDTRTDEEFLRDLENKMFVRNVIKKSLHKRGPSGTKIICVTNGKIYDSIREAANDIDTHSSNICKHLQGNKMYTSCRGLTFKLLK